MTSPRQFRGFTRPKSNLPCWECGELKDDVKEYVFSSEGNYYRYCDECANKNFSKATAERFRANVAGTPK